MGTTVFLTIFLSFIDSFQRIHGLCLGLLSTRLSVIYRHHPHYFYGYPHAFGDTRRTPTDRYPAACFKRLRPPSGQVVLTHLCAATGSCFASVCISIFLPSACGSFPDCFESVFLWKHLPLLQSDCCIDLPAAESAPPGSGPLPLPWQG